MKTLADLGLVRLVGRSELPGHPFLYGTTPFFLEHFGLASLDQLNEIDPTLPRSNPKERAKLFKKDEKAPAQKEGAGTAEEVAKESNAAEPADGQQVPDPEAGEPANGGPDGVDIINVMEEDPESETSDDDVFIDDTPDELDDDDDDEDDEDFDDEDEEDDDEEGEEDEEDEE